MANLYGVAPITIRGGGVQTVEEHGHWRRQGGRDDRRKAQWRETVGQKWSDVLSLSRETEGMRNLTLTSL